MIAKEIYILTSSGKLSKDYSLRDQMCRAAVSISSNIAEGFERNNNNEFIQYLKIAKGSVGEFRTQLYIASEINYIDALTTEKFDYRLEKLSLQIGKLLKYLKDIQATKKSNLLTRKLATH